VGLGFGDFRKGGPEGGQNPDHFVNKSGVHLQVGLQQTRAAVHVELVQILGDFSPLVGIEGTIKLGNDVQAWEMRIPFLA
jgi:hypothetical protein